jgi:hypothetical protein
MATSNHLHGASELMLIADIKRGFVEDASQLVSYATRLQRLLNVFFEGRRVTTEVKLLPGAGPLERLDTIYTTQWAIVERPQHSQLVVSAVFDTSWEAYFRNLQQNTGEELDAIFMHCEGYEAHTCCEHGYEKFSEWIRSKQIQTSFFHVAMPDITVADIRYLRRRSRNDIDDRGTIGNVDEDEDFAQTLAEMPADVGAAKARTESEARAAVEALLALEGLFPGEEKNEGSVPEVAARAYNEQERPTGEMLGSRTARQVYRDAIRALLRTSLDQQYRAAARKVAWLANLDRALPALEPLLPSAVALDTLANIQGNILQPYNFKRTQDRILHGCVLLVQCDDARAMRGLLARLEKRISSASDTLFAADSRKEGLDATVRVNLGLTYVGLQRLGLSPDVLQRMPREFQEGMEKRAGMLGDVGLFAHPSGWEAPKCNWLTDQGNAGTVALSNVDAVLIVQKYVPPQVARDDDWAWTRAHPLHADVEDVIGELPGVHVLHVQPLRRYPSDHFELGEGSQAESQPVPYAARSAAGDQQDVGIQTDEPVPERDHVPLGELILGYPTRHPVPTHARELQGRDECAPRRRDTAAWIDADAALFRDGTFLVLRKLRQDVPRYRRYLQQARQELGMSEGVIKSWILGRRVDGRTLVSPGARDPGNDFDYKTHQPTQCPFHAHVRRANPRLGSSMPRIMRRSFAYGSPYHPERADDDRGLMFMAYNASIAEQFETVQRWISGGNVTGIASRDNDLLCGVPQLRGANRWSPNGGAQKLPVPDAPFVSLRWGMYLFVPSLRAIAALSGGHAHGGEELSEPPEPDPLRIAKSALDPLVLQGQRIVQQLSELKPPERRRDGWKDVLESASQREKAEAVWAFVREQKQGLLDTPYGLLVGTIEHAAKILEDDGKHFSVGVYKERLQRLIASPDDHSFNHYIGLDPRKPDGDKTDYEALSKEPNHHIQKKIRTEHVYASVREALHTVLAPTHERPVAIPLLAARAVATVADRYLGMPAFEGNAEQQTRQALGMIQNFVPISRYCFQPWPESERALTEQAKIAGRRIYDAYQVFDSPLKTLRLSERELRWAVIGATVGFAAPAIAHIIGIVQSWVAQRELPRMHRALASARRAGDSEHVEDRLHQRVWDAMLMRPVPPILYRKILDLSALRVEPPIASETSFAVIGTRSVCLSARGAPKHEPSNHWRSDAAGAWMFGGRHGGLQTSDPTHGCPGREIAVATVAGVVRELLDYPEAKLVGPVGLSLGERFPV